MTHSKKRESCNPCDAEHCALFAIRLAVALTVAAIVVGWVV